REGLRPEGVDLEDRRLGRLAGRVRRELVERVRGHGERRHPARQSESDPPGALPHPASPCWTPPVPPCAGGRDAAVRYGSGAGSAMRPRGRGGRHPAGGTRALSSAPGPSYLAASAASTAVATPP